MNLFFTPSSEVEPGRLTITGQEAVHISRVLRYSVGDKLLVTDGEGTLYTSRIKSIDKEKIGAEILEKKTETREGSFVTLCLGIIKKRDRLEFALEKATELGADRVILFRGQHSEKGNVRIDRAEAAVLAAMKQSLRLFLPEVIFAESLKEAMQHSGRNSNLIVADETSEGDQKAVNKSESYTLIVGPEGGFSEAERKQLYETLSAVPYSLGKYRLRTETAAMVITHRFKSGCI